MLERQIQRLGGMIEEFSDLGRAGTGQLLIRREAIDVELLVSDTASRLQAASVGEIVVKDGADPALVVAGGAETDVPALRVSDAVDTTGAGDSFNGGYLTARLAGHDPVTSAKLAHQTAAATVRVRGALAPVETLRTAFTPA